MKKIKKALISVSDKKNLFVDNRNIVISGMTNKENQTIKWEIIKL